MLANMWLLAAMPRDHTRTDVELLIVLRMINGYSHRVGHRPDRMEPRAVKRRPSPIALLAAPREAARNQVLAGINGKWSTR